MALVPAAFFPLPERSFAGNLPVKKAVVNSKRQLPARTARKGYLAVWGAVGAGVAGVAGAAGSAGVAGAGSVFCATGFAPSINELPLREAV
jgi:hypothetical protein